MNPQLAVSLVPNSWDLRGKSVSLGDREWRLAARLVEESGLRPNSFAGLDRLSVAEKMSNHNYANHSETVGNDRYGERQGNEKSASDGTCIDEARI